MQGIFFCLSNWKVQSQEIYLEGVDHLKLKFIQRKIFGIFIGKNNLKYRGYLGDSCCLGNSLEKQVALLKKMVNSSFE